MPGCSATESLARRARCCPCTHLPVLVQTGSSPLRSVGHSRERPTVLYPSLGRAPSRFLRFSRGHSGPRDVPCLLLAHRDAATVPCSRSHVPRTGCQDAAPRYRCVHRSCLPPLPSRPLTHRREEHPWRSRTDGFPAVAAWLTRRAATVLRSDMVHPYTRGP